MNTAILESLAVHPLIHSIGWTLIHFIWQATLIGIFSALALGVMRQSTARVRYAVACAGMAMMTAAPVATLAYLVSTSNPNDWRAEILMANNTMSAEDRGAEIVHEHIALDLVKPTELSSTSSSVRKPVSQSLNEPDHTAASGMTGVLFSKMESFAGTMQGWLPWCVVLWIFGVLCLAVRLLIGLRQVGRWSRQGTEVPNGPLADAVLRLCMRMNLGQPIRILETAREAVPAVIGWIRPAILVPSSMLSGLTTAELDAILAHELAHIRRHDYLVNLLQTVVETILFYHPAVWWLSTRIRTERENCCDDIAVEVCGNRVVFAQALARMEENRCKQGQLSVAANGGSLVNRIRRIVMAEPDRSVTWWPAGAIVLGVLAILAGSFWFSVLKARPAHAAEKSFPALESPEKSRVESGDDEYKTHKAEVARIDSKTSLEKQVMPDVRLRSDSGKKEPFVSVDMLYANLSNYTFVPARFAKELNAVELGEIDFGNESPKKIALDQQKLIQQILHSLPLPNSTDPAASDSDTSADPVNQRQQVQTVTVGEITEKVVGKTIVPYAEDSFWIPEQLAFYGVNKSGQKKFKVVRIPGVDLGIGPAFGPVNALVLNDENSDFGVLGRDWARIPRGKNGEGFMWSAVGGFYFMALPETEPQSTDPQSTDPAESETVLATHTYDLARRESTGWVEVNGVGIPIDAGVEGLGVRVYVTLMQTLVAVDSLTGEVLWHLDEGKQSPTWRKISILELPEPSGSGSLVVVELEAADGELRRRFHIRTGEEILSSPADSEEAGPTIQILKRDGDRIQLATIESPPAGRAKAELIRSFQEILIRSGGAEQGGWVTDQETLVSAKNVQMLKPGPNEPMAALDAQEVIFNLPEGAGIRAEFGGENIEITSAADVTKVVVTNGRVKLFDSNGVERADASPDGGAEQLVVEVRAVAGERQLKLRTQRLKPDADYPQPPVQVKCSLVTGAPADELQPPHGAVRFAFEYPEENEPARMKIRWHYDLQRLVEEAERESGRKWRDLLMNQGAPLQPAAAVPFQTFENPAMDDEDDVEWGPLAKKSGLQSRLTLMTEKPAIGQPLLLKLELRNSRAEPTEVDLQNYAPHRVLSAVWIQPDGKGGFAPFIGMTPQTSGGPQELAPGEVITVWEYVDATTLFLLDQEEAYQFFAKGGEWATSAFTQDSNHLEVRLQPGQLPPQQALLASLSSMEMRPEDWTVSAGYGAIYLSHSPTDLKRDVTTIQLWFTEEPLPADYKLGEGNDKQNVTTIGPSELGYLHLAATEKALELWPEHVRDIRIAAARALMLPATKISGMVIGQDGDHLDGVRVSLVGEDMPPASSVVANTRTDKGGRFELTGIPTGFKYQILVEPAEAKSPWLAWASAPLVFMPHDDGNTHFEYSIDGKQVDFGCQQLTLILNGNGVNWKTALKEGADRKLELTWEGLSSERQVGAGMAFLELGEKDE